jgi:hypothetical protein
MIGGGLGPWAPGEWTDDTDTGAAIAGGLLGARWGASGVVPPAAPLAG